MKIDIKPEGKAPGYYLLARNIMAPVLDFFRGTETIKCLRYLEKSEWWDRQKLYEIQSGKLRNLIMHAYENVPYYRRIFDERSLKASDINSAADLSKLPVLTRKDVKDYSADLIAGNVPDKQKIVSHTAGSTGEPLRFLSSKHARMNCGYAAMERNLHRAGYELGNKIVMIYGVRSDPFLKKYSATISNFFKRALIINAKQISVNTLPLFAAKINRFNPEYIMCYPGALEILAGFIQQNTEYHIRPRAIISTAEQLYDHQRKLFFDVFYCETFNSYSSWEAPGIASECKKHTGLHISVENFVLETVDDQGFPITEGSEGKILITNLDNYAMPFIRYEIGDAGTLSSQSCSCGRGLPLLAGLNGRASDVIITPDGKLISGTAVVDIAAGTEGVAQFQIKQNDPGEVLLDIISEKGATEIKRDEIRDSIISRYRKVLGKDVTIEVRFVDRIEATQEGKRKFVISSLKSHYNAV